MSTEDELVKNDYLWDGSGEADAAVVRMERELGKFRHAGGAPELPEMFAEAGESRKEVRGARLWFQFAAVAASVLMMFSVWVGLRLQSEQMVTGVGWGVEQVAGAPRGGAEAIRGAGEKSTLRIGQTLGTDQESRASITVSSVGQIEIDPQTRLRLAESRSSRTRMELERGTIDPMIWAPRGGVLGGRPSAPGGG